MKAVFICYPKCSTCKKAENFLIENDIEFITRNIKENIPSIQELTKWLKMSAIDINSFFNTSGLSYRNLGLKDKLKDMTLEDKISLLSSDGMLIKRPLLITESKVLVGFKKDKWEELKNEKMC